ncbi:TIM barrel protein, partial [Candidatus Poribacteria bacterium]|nr:TIM barrel protein [Candidatus Poribacteria bacterium]
MPHIKYLPDGCEVETAADESILEASLRAGIPHANACAAKARCSTCRVVVVDGAEHCSERTEAEAALATRLHFADNIRLACQTRIAGDVTVRRPVLDDVDIAVTSQLGKDALPDHVGEEMRIAILFADISGYTSFVESLPPYDVVHALNRYFYLMHGVVEENGGHVSDYVGDGLLAFFGIDDASSATTNAVTAGLSMFDAVERLNAYLDPMYGRTFRIRVGVHYGEVVVGTIGIGDIRKLAAFGDAVNFASRVETANKAAGTDFLISDAAREQLDGRAEIGRAVVTKLRGKTGEHVLHEVLGMSDANTPPQQTTNDGQRPTRMELSCSSCCVPKLSLDEALALFADAGYAYFETFTTWTGAKLDAHDIDKADAKRRIDDSGLRLSSLNVENFRAEAEADYAARIDRQRRNVEWGVELGCGQVNFKGGARTEEDMRALIRGAADLARFCEDLPVALAVGNHYGNRVQDLSDISRVLGEVDHPKLGLLLDIGHFHSAGVPIPPIIDAHAKRLTLVHTKDQVGTRSVPFGEGEIENADLLRRVSATGYDGFLVVEVEVE